MNKAQKLHILSSRLGEIQRRFTVEHISLFGSVARDEAQLREQIMGCIGCRDVACNVCPYDIIDLER